MIGLVSPVFREKKHELFSEIVRILQLSKDRPASLRGASKPWAPPWFCGPQRGGQRPGEGQAMDGGGTLQ